MEEEKIEFRDSDKEGLASKHDSFIKNMSQDSYQDKMLEPQLIDTKDKTKLVGRPYKIKTKKKNIFTPDHVFLIDQNQFTVSKKLEPVFLCKNTPKNVFESEDKIGI